LREGIQYLLFRRHAVATVSVLWFYGAATVGVLWFYGVATVFVLGSHGVADVGCLRHLERDLDFGVHISYSIRAKFFL
jgi:hypothetical protein